MLYERWRQIARDNADAIALRDIAAARSWTFAQLAAEAGRGIADNGPVAYPRGADSDFIFSTLRAWRENKIVCPLEPGQERPRFPVPPPRCAHLKTTSATGGAARLVAFTAEQLAADAENIVVTMGLRRDWPNIGVISLAHSYGFSNLVTPLLLHGIPLILAPAPLPEIVRRIAESATAVTLPAVPAMWRAWHQAVSISPNVKLAISAGAPLPLALEQEVFSCRGVKIHNFYGASECGGIAFDTSHTPRTDAADVGSAMQNVSATVADGCLKVCGRAVAESYWPQADASLANGCFHTSDLAEILDGKIFLRGRAGDQINIAGRKVAPEIIERALLKHPAVDECLVFGVPSRDEARAEEIVAIVVTQESEASLRQFSRESLPAWQTPRHWWFVDALQANPRGKVSRGAWRERWLGAVR